MDNQFISGIIGSISRATLDRAAKRISGHPLEVALSRHLLAHYDSLMQDPPSHLLAAKYLCYEQAKQECTILMAVAPPNGYGYGPDYFDHPERVIPTFTLDEKTGEEERLPGIFAQIPDILIEMETLPILGVGVKDFAIEDILATLDELVAEETSAEVLAAVETSVEEKQVELSAIVARKGGGQLQEDLCTLNKKSQLAFTNMGKRTRKDYYPTADELWVINQGYSNTELAPEDVLVFSLSSANIDTDRQNEKFSDSALNDMAGLSLDKAFLIDHKWETSSQVGKIFAAEARDGQLFQKVYVLNDAMNDSITKNILAGIYNKVSVGFASNLKDMICDSCTDKSIYDSACPHMPGATDEKGNKTTVTIKSVNDYFEVSLVPIPAQRDAGIRRRSHTITSDMVKTFEETGKYFAESVKAISEVLDTLSEEEALEESATQDQSKNFDTIISSRLDLGDQQVSEPTTTSSTPEVKAPYVAVTEESAGGIAANREHYGDAIAEAAREPLEGTGMEEVPAGPAAPTPQAPVYDKAAKSKKTLKALKKLRKGLQKSVAKLEAAVEKLASGSADRVESMESSQKALESKLETLSKIVELATATSLESLERDMKAKRQTAVTSNGKTVADSNEWASKLAKGILGGK